MRGPCIQRRDRWVAKHQGDNAIGTNLIFLSSLSADFESVTAVVQLIRD